MNRRLDHKQRVSPRGGSPPGTNARAARTRSSKPTTRRTAKNPATYPHQVNPPMSSSVDRLTDEELFRRYRDEGARADFEALYARFNQEIYRYLVRYLNDASLANDVFQNTFIQVHLKRSYYEDGRPVRPWLYAIAYHQAVDALRKVGRHPTISLDQRKSEAGGESDTGALVDLLVSEETGPLDDLLLKERRDWVRRSIAQLPEALRQTVILAYNQNLKYREIAEILEIPVGTVKSRLHAATHKLAEMARRDRLERTATA